MLVELIGGKVAIVKSTPDNLKITCQNDLKIAKSILKLRELEMRYRFGSGIDVHRFCSGRPLILGGVTIPFDKGLLGHSDADVLTHAIIDALLGALR